MGPQPLVFLVPLICRFLDHGDISLLTCAVDWRKVVQVPCIFSWFAVLNEQPTRRGQFPRMEHAASTESRGFFASQSLSGASGAEIVLGPGWPSSDVQGNFSGEVGHIRYQSERALPCTRVSHIEVLNDVLRTRSCTSQANCRILSIHSTQLGPADVTLHMSIFGAKDFSRLITPLKSPPYSLGACTHLSKANRPFHLGFPIWAYVWSSPQTANQLFLSFWAADELLVDADCSRQLFTA